MSDVHSALAGFSRLEDDTVRFITTIRLICAAVSTQLACAVVFVSRAESTVAVPDRSLGFNCRVNNRRTFYGETPICKVRVATGSPRDRDNDGLPAGLTIKYTIARQPRYDRTRGDFSNLVAPSHVLYTFDGHVGFQTSPGRRRRECRA